MTDTAEQFRNFIDGDRNTDESPLYARLSLAAAEEPELLALAETGREGQVRPNIFFAAVRYLLMAHPDDPLAAWHPDIGVRSPHGDPVEQLRRFCARHREELVALMSRRLVQTNEPLRAAILRPALQEVQRRAQRPLAIVDAGTSLGVMLCVDKVACDYGDGVIHGDPESPLRLRCELRGPHRPPVDAPLDIVWRRGIDLEPVDPDDEAAVSWLRALIWPGDVARLGRLDDALALVRSVRPEVIKGNAAEVLPDVCDAAPDDAHLCVITTYVRMHQTREDREAMEARLRDLAARRPLSWITTARTPDGTDGVALVLRDPISAMEERLALHHGHGYWLQWSLPDGAA